MKGRVTQVVGAYETKTHFPRLLDQVARGEEIQIKRHGRAVARLVPESPTEARDVQATIARIRAFRKGRRLGRDLTICKLIEAGRKG